MGGREVMTSVWAPRDVESWWKRCGNDAETPRALMLSPLALMAYEKRLQRLGGHEPSEDQGKSLATRDRHSSALHLKGVANELVSAGAMVLWAGENGEDVGVRVGGGCGELQPRTTAPNKMDEGEGGLPAPLGGGAGRGGDGSLAKEPRVLYIEDVIQGSIALLSRCGGSCIRRREVFVSLSPHPPSRARALCLSVCLSVSLSVCLSLSLSSHTHSLFLASLPPSLPLSLSHPAPALPPRPIFLALFPPCFLPMLWCSHAV